jgi:hypothetical protein
MTPPSPPPLWCLLKDINLNKNGRGGGGRMLPSVSQRECKIMEWSSNLDVILSFLVNKIKHILDDFDLNQF